MGPTALAQVLRPLARLFPSERYPDLLVGLDSPDDAAVLRIGDSEALVVTTDFFPPVLDDPFDYGAVAAANAMSDVFAMGGDVLLALNLAVFPGNLSTDTCAAIIEGGAAKVAEAGAVLAGGHTVTAGEPMYGLAVVGRLDPARMLRKAGARVGDTLVLTKSLGSGLVTTALKRGLATPEHVARATAGMASLNMAAGRAAVAVGARAATDVTGFGLLGHATEMAVASRVGLALFLDRIALLPGTLEYARDGFADRVVGLDRLDPIWPSVLYDPQTSGGLLVALSPSRADELLSMLQGQGETAAIVGDVVEGSGVAVHSRK